jgi:hypothetical protein
MLNCYSIKFLITEDLSKEEILKTSNDLTSDELWNKNAEDFFFALII